MKRSWAISAAACVFSALGAIAHAGPELAITPQGLYFHSFTGAATGTEWATWGPIDGEGRYELADLPAAGVYPATVTPDGSIVLDHGRGTGLFRADGSASIDFTLGGGVRFHSEIHRAPRTDERFPVFFTEAIAGDASLAGAWSARVLELNPDTGETIAEHAETVQVAVVGTTVRVTQTDGSYVQGVWLADDQAGFRVVSPQPRLVRYRTFPGCESSLAQDLVGDLRVTGADSMTLALCFQTRAPLGSQVQSMRYMELTRVPTPAGAAVLVLAAPLGARRRRITKEDER